MLTLWLAFATPREHETTHAPRFANYRHSATHPYYLDLRAFGQGRKFFKTKAKADAERLRQATLRERGGRQAVGLPLDELAMMVKAKKDLGLTVKQYAMPPRSISIIWSASAAGAKNILAWKTA